VRRSGLDVSSSGQGAVGGSCKYGDEPSCSTKGGEFLGYLRDY
jgi:hypothetical protein